MQKGYTMILKEENIRLIFGLKIKQLRTDKGLSLAELGEKTGISISYLNEMEKGKKYPKSEKIAALSDALEVNYDWLVSLQLNKRLKPIGDLLKSNILSELPFEIFGIEPSDILDILSDTPTKVGAFISTLAEMSRGYDMKVEDFYLSALRSYIELHENYFEEIEVSVDALRAEMSEDTNFQNTETLKELLQSKYHYTFFHDDFVHESALKNVRSVLISSDKKHKLVLNSGLENYQQAFVLAREIGFNRLKMSDRPYNFPLTKVKSFEQALSSYKASYFAAALLINRRSLEEDVKKLFANSHWDGTQWAALAQRYDVSPEVFLVRLSSILPRSFGINQLFFLRFDYHKETEEVNLIKEMHLAGLHNPHATILNEHYCRRWVSLTILPELAAQQAQGNALQTICKAQISKYIGTKSEYLVVAFARPSHLKQSRLSSVAIGLKVDNDLRKHVAFLNDEEHLPSYFVSQTCERCKAEDCAERMAKPTVLLKRQQELNRQNALVKLGEKYK